MKDIAITDKLETCLSKQVMKNQVIDSGSGEHLVYRANCSYKPATLQ
jgi:hypothetical protein